MTEATPSAPSLIILLSGPIASGKSTVGKLLADRYGIHILKTQKMLLALRPDIKPERGALHVAGEQLEKQTNGAWVADGLDKMLESVPAGSIVMVDAVRTPAQAAAIRARWGNRVKHLHITASKAELERRYLARRNTIEDPPTYDEAINSAIERLVPQLEALAEVPVKTDNMAPDEVARVAANGLKLKAPGPKP